MGGQPLTTAACPLLINLQTGVCRRGDACPYSHGVFECWLHPSRYRTQVRFECCIMLSVRLEEQASRGATAALACSEVSLYLRPWVLCRCPVLPHSPPTPPAFLAHADVHRRPQLPPPRLLLCPL